MRCGDIMEELERFAPPDLAESWDNVGLLVGDSEKEVKRIYLALDASKKVILQAAEWGADLLITHHPMIFNAMKRIVSQDTIGEKVRMLIEHDISYYAMHTNCDIAVMAEKSCEMLDIRTEAALNGEAEGSGRIGFFDKTMTLREVTDLVKERFHIPDLKAAGDLDWKIRRVAVCPGSGKSFMDEVYRLKPDLYITADIDHHMAIDAVDAGLALIDAGHFGTEHFMVYEVKQCLEEFRRQKDNNAFVIGVAVEDSPFQSI